MTWIWLPIVVIIALGYVMLMNYLGGEKHFLGNRIRETISSLKRKKRR